MNRWWVKTLSKVDKLQFSIWIICLDGFISYVLYIHKHVMYVMNGYNTEFQERKFLKKKKEDNHMSIAVLDSKKEKQTEWQASIIL